MHIQTIDVCTKYCSRPEKVVSLCGSLRFLAFYLIFGINQDLSSHEMNIFLEIPILKCLSKSYFLDVVGKNWAKYSTNCYRYVTGSNVDIPKRLVVLK